MSRLSNAQVMYHFISGYTAKVAGTEEGVTEPQATFSPCFGGPFLALHPYAYAEMLAAKLEQQGASAWLVNTGWVGGGYGVGKRCSLKYTRQIIDAIHDGTLKNLPDSDWETMPIFGLSIPRCNVKDVPLDVLKPALAWSKAGYGGDFEDAAKKLAHLFSNNFVAYADKCTSEVAQAGPEI